MTSLIVPSIVLAWMATFRSFGDEKDLIETKESVRHCEQCGLLNDKDVCDICASNYRDKTQIMVVKDTKDVLAIEKTNQYNGLYHVLNGLISPLDGIGPSELGLDLLESRFAEGVIKEIILATNSTVEGEATAHYISEIAKQYEIEVSRIAHGVPLGGELEYLDSGTLSHAFASRKSY